MTENEWTQVQTYIEHSGLEAEEVMKACQEYQAKRQRLEPTSDPMHGLPGQLSLPGIESFNGA